MKILTKQSDKIRPRAQKGFTLIELMVAMAIFLFISAVAFRLFSLQQNSASLLRDQVALNLALRNAVSQIQVDVSNAGSGYFQGVNIPSWPVGVTISNNVVASGNSCYNSTTSTYGKDCFDQMNVITAADPTTFPPAKLTDSTGGTSPTANCSNTTAGIAYLQNATGFTLAQTAGEFKNKDQILFLNSDGSKLTTAVLTSDAAVAGSAVKLTFNATNADGSNSLTNDPLDITACDNVSPCTAGNKLAVQFCGGDYAIKLAPITYVVCSGPGSPSVCPDTTSTSPDIQDPKLYRIQPTSSGLNKAIVMEQIIGFKMGATIYNAAKDTSTDEYQYNSACYSTDPSDPTNPCKDVGNVSLDVKYNFTLVRSVRASVIARTPPNRNASYTYRNTFDQGPYQVQGMAVVVSPRNMSMND
jgi:prepilin-type N-terminal cleavage/methylation domain-containing protein